MDSNNSIKYDLDHFEDYNLNEINKHLNKIIREDFSSIPMKDQTRQLAKKYREAKGVYKITDLTDNRIYIGSTGSNGRLIRRLKRHLNDLKKGAHFNSHLQRCYNKHGLTNFDFQIVEFYKWQPEISIAENKSHIEKREQYYIDTLGARKKDTGFNQADHAHGGFNDVTWDTLEKRTNITVEQLKEIIELLNTSMRCIDIDTKVGVRRGTTLRFYKRHTLSKIREECDIKERDTSSKGENSSSSKLTLVQVKEIIEELKIGTPISLLAKKYGVDKAAIHDIKNKRNWKYLTKDVTFFNYPVVQKDEDLPPVYQYSLNGEYQKEWKNYREVAVEYGVETSAINEAIKSNSLYRLNHLWSYEKKERFESKCPITLFFYCYVDGKEDVFFEINYGQPCACCPAPQIPIVLYDLTQEQYLWGWHSRSELAKKVMREKYNPSVFSDYRIFQNRYKIIPMRDLSQTDLIQLKKLLENEKEIDYSILGYDPLQPKNKSKFPIKKEKD